MPQSGFDTVAAVHNSFLRRIAGDRRGPTQMSHARLLQVTGGPDFVQHLDQLRLRRLGHIMRMPDSAVVKQLLFATGLEGRGNLVGRPSTEWRHLAAASLHRMGLREESQWGPLTRDRDTWRAVCRSVPLRT